MHVLILLLGGNPLPNYVAAKYLLISGREDDYIMPVPDKIIFICSNRTKKFLRTITKNKELNLKHNQYCYINLEDQQRKPFVIRNRLLNKLEELNQQEKPVKSLHLNYTGGTKPMAVNSFIAVNEFLKHRELKVIFSDLDPDHFKIIPTGLDFEKNSAVEYPLKGDLRDYVKLNINSILDLHEMKTRNQGTTKFIFDETKVHLNQFCRDVVREKDIKCSWSLVPHPGKSNTSNKKPLKPGRIAVCWELTGCHYRKVTQTI